MSNDDYVTGYKDGYGDGWAAAKAAILPKVKDVKYEFVEDCPVCGIGKNGEPLGVVCQHPLCPTRKR